MGVPLTNAPRCDARTNRGWDERQWPAHCSPVLPSVQPSLCLQGYRCSIRLASARCSLISGEQALPLHRQQMNRRSPRRNDNGRRTRTLVQLHPTPYPGAGCCRPARPRVGPASRRTGELSWRRARVSHSSKKYVSISCVIKVVCDMRVCVGALSERSMSRVGVRTVSVYVRVIACWLTLPSKPLAESGAFEGMN